MNLFAFIELNKKDGSDDTKSIDDYFDLVRIDEEDRFKLIKSYSYGMKTNFNSMP